MDCRSARLLFSDARHGRLAPEDSEQRQAHLQDCDACREAEQAERALTDVLCKQLPVYPASSSLKRRLDRDWLESPSRPQAPLRLRFAFLSMAAVACAALVFVTGFLTGKRQRETEPTVAMEAVNDHLRMLEGETSLQVMASDLHQVKPWFAGKLDFAPPVAFKGDHDYPLIGGQIARFLNQRAACFVFARRLHKVSLFVLPIRGLSDASLSGMAWGTAPRPTHVSRGFSVVTWQGDEFGYVLVSDLNTAELLDLANRIQSAR
jgi:anti-sigma factor RsiW